MSGSRISLDDVIAKVRGGGGDARGEEIVAAAIQLKESCGRERKGVLRKMANPWGVRATENVGDKNKWRSNKALAEDIHDAVCKAALDWEAAKKERTTAAKRA